MAEQLIQTHQLGTGTRDGSHFLRDDGTWAIPAGTGGGSGSGGSGALVPIQVIGPLVSAQSTLSFTGIPQTGYRNLKLVVHGRGTTSAATTNVILQFNGDTGSNYTTQQLLSTGASTSSANVGTVTSVTLGDMVAATGTTNSSSSFLVDIPDYIGTTFWKNLSSRQTNAQTPSQFLIGGTWKSTSAISSIVLTPAAGNFDVGSYACLYGEMDTVSGLVIGPGSSASGSGALVPIQVVGPITATQATIPFAGIPQTGFRNLRLVVIARSTAAATSVTCNMQFNGDTGSNYDIQAGVFVGSTSTGVRTSGATAGQIGNITAASSLAGTSGSINVSLPNYVGSTFHKNWVASSYVNASASAAMQADFFAGRWASTAAISSITLTPASGSFDIGSYACLYGEMDTAGVLLTPASNLISETVLSVAQSTISIPNIPQNYRDLRVTIQAAGSQSATSVNVLMQINADTGSNYDFVLIENGSSSAGETGAATGTSAQFGVIPASTSRANAAGQIDLLISNYTGTTFEKPFSSISTYRTGSTLATLWGTHTSGAWRSTAAVTSILLSLSAGNFVAGSTVRVYGEPASAGGSAVGTGTRLRISTNQAIATATATSIAWDVEDNDADNQHFISAAALTGTVAKTSGSQTLTGTSTLFTTELSVGQVISVPGTATEVAVVIAIASATSLTVATPFANSASGQTATRVNTSIVFRQPGFYTLEATVYSAAISTGNVTLQFRLNGSTIIDQKDQAGINAAAGYELVTQRQFQQWDYVEVLWTQSSGGSVNVTADERTHFSSNARPTVIVAVPYVNVQDQKSSGTAGGTFTAGSYVTRILNTIVSDSAGIASLNSNQITLPPGTYRCNVRAPAYACDRHQARLQNITNSTTIFYGTTEILQSSVATISPSMITGRFTLPVLTVLEVQHRCSTTTSTNGLGFPASFGNTEIYTVAEFWKEG